MSGGRRGCIQLLLLEDLDGLVNSLLEDSLNVDVVEDSLLGQLKHHAGDAGSESLVDHGHTLVEDVAEELLFRSIVFEGFDFLSSQPLVGRSCFSRLSDRGRHGHRLTRQGHVEGKGHTDWLLGRHATK